MNVIGRLEQEIRLSIRDLTQAELGAGNFEMLFKEGQQMELEMALREILYYPDFRLISYGGV
jgi:hypothetical protein